VTMTPEGSAAGRITVVPELAWYPMALVHDGCYGYDTMAGRCLGGRCLEDR
jgi:hypothetical protein